MFLNYKKLKAAKLVTIEQVIEYVDDYAGTKGLSAVVKTKQFNPETGEELDTKIKKIRTTTLEYECDQMEEGLTKTKLAIDSNRQLIEDIKALNGKENNNDNKKTKKSTSSKSKSKSKSKS